MKRLAWSGAGLILLGIILGFVKWGKCGSVFQGRDDTNDRINALLGSEPPDCTTAIDLTVPVWILIGVGVVLLIVSAVKGDWSKDS